ncbi:hypothetical protein [Campylobacter porcelli]|nr:hypothetical protein [Campylobacter sp. P0124]
MHILSHRGWWQDSSEKNQMIAFQREFKFCQKALNEQIGKYMGGG